MFTRLLIRWIARHLLLAVIVTCSFCALLPSAHAQEILRDAETEHLLSDLAKPLVNAAGLDTRNVKVVLLNDPEVNAFVAGGQIVYINSGLLLEADNAAQVQAVIAHELGHVAGGHAIDDRGAKRASHINILSMALGAAAAATGNGEAAMGVVMAGQQAAMGSYLAYTRIEEESADAAGARYLAACGISGKASIEFFHHLLNLENRHGVTRTQDDQFWATHPLTTDRIAMLSDTYQRDKAWNKPYDESLNVRFARVKAKLTGYLEDPEQTLIAYPADETSPAAHYAHAYALSKQGLTDQAIAELDAILNDHPGDPYVLEAKGELLLAGDRPADAVAPLTSASQALDNTPLVATTLAHALFASDEAAGTTADHAQARQLIEAAIARDRANPFSWHVLGMLEAADGQELKSQLAAAEEALLAGRPAEARQLARRVLDEFASGSPEAIEAGDILGAGRGQQ